MRAYKAFKPGNRTFNGLVLEEGRTYTSHEDIRLSSRGFHAALDPMFCLNFVTPSNGGIYYEVEVGGVTDFNHVRTAMCQSSPICGESITLIRKLSFDEMLLLSLQIRLAKTTEQAIGKSFRNLCTVSPDLLTGHSYASGDGSIAVAGSVSGGLARCTGTDGVAITTERATRAIASGKDCLCVSYDPDALVRTSGRYMLFMIDGVPHAFCSERNNGNFTSYRMLNASHNTIIQTRPCRL